MATHRLNIPTRAGCKRGKRRFHDRIEAEAFAQVLAGKNQVTGRGKPGHDLHVYWCEPCQAFHAGHKQP
jgi:hypothetical protein